MTTMTPDVARSFWKALVDNASQLISDAHLLLEAGSHGHARALTVLAEEELGKALWVYNAFSTVWNDGSTEVLEVVELSERASLHLRKYMESYVFGDELSAFWGDYSDYEDPGPDEASWKRAWEKRKAEALARAKEANALKQQGFYVDISKDSTITGPRDVSLDGIDNDLSRAAQVIEMLLIKDHSRMKFDSRMPYDSTHEQQWRLLPVSHPEDFADFIDRIRKFPEAKNSDPGDAGESS